MQAVMSERKNSASVPNVVMVIIIVFTGPPTVMVAVPLLSGDDNPVLVAVNVLDNGFAPIVIIDAPLVA